MLVSTVENVKRAYLDLHAASLAKGKGRENGPEPLLGLWQYNETGCLEDLEEYRVLPDERNELAEAERALERLQDVLGGKTGCVWPAMACLFAATVKLTAPRPPRSSGPF